MVQVRIENHGASPIDPPIVNWSIAVMPWVPDSLPAAPPVV
jgi:hypothetical protein